VHLKWNCAPTGVGKQLKEGEHFNFRVQGNPGRDSQCWYGCQGSAGCGLIVSSEITFPESMSNQKLPHVIPPGLHMTSRWEPPIIFKMQ